ncbi:hypothetical protein BC938DRAFT_475451 [Jimgerdemannia flammicorona]|uniref:Uncharacterized protein n=1 Tax=Jimgerdemannia flammicorona TaxID=994334 RepID=A0A433PUN2_9FUNG|nr:hypothetical protein BC938DRAFT_475451 [Jimgerdemannia flammicorona]
MQLRTTSSKIWRITSLEQFATIYQIPNDEMNDAHSFTMAGMRFLGSVSTEKIWHLLESFFLRRKYIKLTDTTSCLS